MTREAFSTVMATLAVVAAIVLVTVGVATARNNTIQECHPALVFPRENCGKYNGGWMCSGSAVETRMCYHASEGDPR